jgi:hypothetical protein
VEIVLIATILLQFKVVNVAAFNEWPPFDALTLIMFKVVLIEKTGTRRAAQPLL